MKNGQAARRSRGRSNSRPNHSNQRYGDANRNEPRVKGNAAQLVEKYKSMAKDAMGSGDRVLSENYLQHADHYLRVLNEKQAGKPTPPPQNKAEDSQGGDEAKSRPAKRQRRPRRQEEAEGVQEAPVETPAETPAETPVASESVEVEAEEPVKKIRRTRKTKAVEAEVVDEATSTEASPTLSEEAVAEEKPKRRRRLAPKAPAPEENAAE